MFCGNLLRAERKKKRKVCAIYENNKGNVWCTLFARTHIMRICFVLTLLEFAYTRRNNVIKIACTWIILIRSSKKGCALSILKSVSQSHVIPTRICDTRHILYDSNNGAFQWIRMMNEPTSERKYAHSYLNYYVQRWVCVLCSLMDKVIHIHIDTCVKRIKWRDRKFASVTTD